MGDPETQTNLEVGVDELNGHMLSNIHNEGLFSTTVANTRFILPLHPYIRHVLYYTQCKHNTCVCCHFLEVEVKTLKLCFS